MTIRIDAPLWPAHGTHWAHLVSDESLAELHAFARRAGLPKRAFDLDHYDVPVGRVEELIGAGAVVTERRELVRALAASGLRVAGRDRVTAKRVALQHRWDVLLPGTEQIGSELLDRWHEPHRRYHTAAHLTHVLNSLDVLLIDMPAPRQVSLALWFHDAVYDGVPGVDESASASLARGTLAPWIGEEDTHEVVRLVLLTAGHAPEPDDDAGALVSDADLAILAASPDKYARYARSIRSEYAHVRDEQFYPARNQVLESLMGQQRIFHTRVGQSRWESQSRENLQGEIAANQQRIAGRPSPSDPPR